MHLHVSIAAETLPRYLPVATRVVEPTGTTPIFGIDFNEIIQIGEGEIRLRQHSLCAAGDPDPLKF